MRMLRPIVALLVAFSSVLFGASVTRAATGFTCLGGPIPPGVYSSLTVVGACVVPPGVVVNVAGNMTIAPNGFLFAATQTAVLTVSGSVMVQDGGALVLGCSVDSGCPTQNSGDRVDGNIVASQPLAVILEGNIIGGNVAIRGGGGGLNCIPSSLLQGLPLYSDLEDNTIRGSVSIVQLQSCWFGFIRNRVMGNVIVNFNSFADPDATEIVTNTIAGFLACFNNSPAAQVGDSGGAPNLVAGPALGECAALVGTS